MKVSSEAYMGMAGSWADVTAFRREVRRSREEEQKRTVAAQGDILLF